MQKLSAVDVALLFRTAPFQTPDGKMQLVGWHLHTPCLEFFSNDIDTDTERTPWFFPGRRFFQANEVKPLLRPFAALCEPLADGTVPAVEVAKLCWSRLKPYKSLYAELINDREIRMWNRLGGAPTIWAGQLENGNVMSAAADYLRRHHFVVGLTPDQYVTGE